MPAAANFYNEDGALQFSTEAVAYVFVDKGTTSTLLGYPVYPPVNYAGDGGSIATFPPFGSALVLDPSDLVVLSCDDYPIFTQREDNIIIVPKGGPEGTMIKWWRFKPFTGQNPGDNFGLRLFDVNGGLTYSSNLKPMLHAGNFNVTTMNSGMNTFVPLPAGRTFAYLTQPSRRRRFSIDGQTPTFTPVSETDSVVTPGDNASLSVVRNSESPKGFYVNEMAVLEWIYEPSDYAGYVLAVDVTGL